MAIMLHIYVWWPLRVPTSHVLRAPGVLVVIAVLEFLGLGAVVAVEVLELGGGGPEVLVVGAVLEFLVLGASGPEVLVVGAAVVAPEVLELGAVGPECHRVLLGPLWSSPST